MFLKELHILKNDEWIRKILFRKGINLIVDETDSSILQESGNNVGKTTVLRLIDFCLGGSGENIYVDQEFKNQVNTEVKKFLTENNILIRLILKTDLDLYDSEEILIERNFLKYGQKIQNINHEKYNNVEFQRKLKRLIFNSGKEKPTFKQIISKNIRDEKNRLVNTLRVLGPWGSNDVYEALFLFWLGVDIDNAARKQALLQQINAETKLRIRLERDNTIPQLNQFLAVLNRNIALLEVQKQKFNLNENYEQDLVELNKVKLQLNRAIGKISRLEVRRDLILESKQELESNVSNIDTNRVRDLYNRAKTLIPDIQKSFQETLAFHNQMIAEKVEFITRELPQLSQEIQVIKQSISTFLIQEEGLTNELLKSNTLEELQYLISELNKSYEQKGTLSEKKRQLEEVFSKIKEKSTELAEIEMGIKSRSDLIEERIKKFNEFFSDLSYKLYGEHFVLVPEDSSKGIILTISSLSGNLGTGKKKGQIAAFDLAYIQFAESIGIECLHFILHDQIENVHENQITNLLQEIVTNINCQYILPVLEDKLPSEIDVKKYQILSLSQKEKLFKI